MFQKRSRNTSYPKFLPILFFDNPLANPDQIVYKGRKEAIAMLMRCQECGLEISSDSRYCPRCGKPSFDQEQFIRLQSRNARSANGMWTIVGIIMLLLGLFLIFGGSCSIKLV